jgi:dihydropyrimidine dehydrogenase (NAD+) subunit PreA
MAGKYISGMGGVETWMDAFEFIALGSGNVQVTTAVMKYGYRIIEELIRGLSMYLTEKGFHSVNDIRGIALDSVSETTDVLERDTVVFPRFHSDKCIGCGRCMVSCMDGGHQAIRFDQHTRKPELIGKKCVGCHLCRLVCAEEAIGVAKKAVRK